MTRRHVSKKDAKGVAEERVDRLFELAGAAANAGNSARAKRYVALALRMSERHKVPARHKRLYCRACGSYFVPARTVRVRTGKGRVVMTCLECGNVQRYPMARERER